MEKGRLKFVAISILIGLLVGAIVLLISGFNPIEAYWIMLKGIFGSFKYISWTIIRSTPLILTGLSVAFAFRTGLFNIGAEGQFIIGALAATLAGYFLNLPPVAHALVALLAGIVAAAIWGGIAGFLKAKFGVHEVIATIMLNWVALYLNNYMVFSESFKRPNSEASQRILESASISILDKWKNSPQGKEVLANNGLLSDILSTPVNWGFIIAILLAVLTWYILKKTTLGYELRTVGSNRFAAEYGGINVKKSMVISMAIAGALSGVAGAAHVLGVTREVAILSAMEGNGFDGIAVALIANNNPIGVIFAGLLFGAIKYGGPKIQYTMGAPSEIINIMIGTIVFFIAMPNFIKYIRSIRDKKRGDKNAN